MVFTYILNYDTVIQYRFSVVLCDRHNLPLIKHDYLKAIAWALEKRENILLRCGNDFRVGWGVLSNFFHGGMTKENRYVDGKRGVSSYSGYVVRWLLANGTAYCMSMEFPYKVLLATNPLETPLSYTTEYQISYRNRYGKYVPGLNRM